MRYKESFRSPLKLATLPDDREIMDIADRSKLEHGIEIRCALYDMVRAKSWEQEVELSQKLNKLLESKA